MNWFKRAALRWALGMSKKHLRKLEDSASAVGVTFESVMKTAPAYRLAELGRVKKEREIQEAHAEELIDKYERENGLA